MQRDEQQTTLLIALKFYVAVLRVGVAEPQKKPGGQPDRGPDPDDPSRGQAGHFPQVEYKECLIPQWPASLSSFVG